MLAQAHRRPSRVKHQPSHRKLPAVQVSHLWVCPRDDYRDSEVIREAIYCTAPWNILNLIGYNVHLTHSVHLL